MTTEQEWTEDRDLFVAAGGADTGPLADEFVRLGESLARVSTVSEVLHQVVHAARAVVPGADLVSVTLRDSTDVFRTPVETDALATRLDELQYRFDEGPCVAATRKGGLGVVHEPALVDALQFPRWAPAALELGVGGVLAVGLFPQGATPRMGALNLYSLTPGALDAKDRDLTLVLAAYVSTALAATQACEAADLEAAQLREALRSRDVIGQAKGILMERRGITAQEAFDILRRTSQDLNVKLAQVAETLAARRGEL